MSHPENCPRCGGNYNYGTALYSYYHCGHSFPKPLKDDSEPASILFGIPASTMVDSFDSSPSVPDSTPSVPDAPAWDGGGGGFDGGGASGDF